MFDYFKHDLIYRVVSKKKRNSVVGFFIPSYRSCDSVIVVSLAFSTADSIKVIDISV